MTARLRATLGGHGILEVEDHRIGATFFCLFEALGTIARHEQHRSHAKYSLQNGIKTPQVCHGTT
jgi:hypothetical protein